MPLAICLLLAVVSCNKSGATLNAAAAQTAADSIIAAQAADLETKAAADCQARMATEVAAQADSMFAALQASAAAPAGK